MNSIKSITALSAEDFEARWSVRHAEIFVGRSLPGNPFTQASWRIVCVCGPSGYVNEQSEVSANSSDPHERIYAALIDAIHATDDAEIAGCLLDAPHLNDSFFESPVITPSTFLNMRRKALDAYDLHFFGRSCRWGMVASADEEVSMVGGDTAFMQQVIAGAGGEIALREAFMHCADYLLRFSRPTAEFVERLQGLAGWNRAL